MSREERTGWRDELFSKWHRQIESGNRLKCVDGDWNEICGACWQTLAMFELCADYWRVDKPAYATQKRAQRLDVPAYILLYRGYEKDEKVELFFRWKRLHPNPMQEFKDASSAAISTLIWNIHRYCRFCGKSMVLPEGVRSIRGFGTCLHGLEMNFCNVCNGGVRRMIKETA